jgi:RNA polymerase sigma factor (sigma-70 family)
MKGNTSSMVLTAGNIIQLRQRPNETGSAARVQDRETFLAYLLPVKKHLYNFVRKNFKTWVFTIAHNLLKDAFREKQLRHWPLSLEEVGEITADAVSNDVREIYATAAALKPRHREVFFLYYYNEFTIPEIVEITGLTRPNIKFMLHQARKAIKRIMEVQV